MKRVRKPNAVPAAVADSIAAAVAADSAAAAAAVAVDVPAAAVVVAIVAAAVVAAVVVAEAATVAADADATNNPAGFIRGLGECRVLCCWRCEQKQDLCTTEPRSHREKQKIMSSSGSFGGVGFIGQKSSRKNRTILFWLFSVNPWLRGAKVLLLLFRGRYFLRFHRQQSPHDYIQHPNDQQIPQRGNHPPAPHSRPHRMTALRTRTAV